jgi:hypothetical protein
MCFRMIPVGTFCQRLRMSIDHLGVRRTRCCVWVGWANQVTLRQNMRDSNASILVARGRFEFGCFLALPSAGFSFGGGDPEPSSGNFLAPMLCVVPRGFDHYTTGLPNEGTQAGVS